MIEAIDFVLGALAIIIGGFWMMQARKDLRNTSKRSYAWLGPLQAILYRKLVKKSPEKQETYVMAIIAGNILIVLLLLALL
jgi:drug/metabolite transporter superfamily protein YnfA